MASPRRWAQEGVAPSGITVNAIAPGYIDTDMVAAVPPEVLAKIVARIPVGRLGQASEIARGVLFLVADEGGFITGSTMSINGGQHMHEDLPRSPFDKLRVRMMEVLMLSLSKHEGRRSS